jgi:DNA-binding PadR family transcriptional regulator
MSRVKKAKSEPASTSELVVLGLLAEKPGHGYEIEASIRARRLRDWAAIGFSSVYHVLNRLERRRLLADRILTTHKAPAQRVYRLTAEGRNTLRGTLRAALSKSGNSVNEIELAIMFAHFLPEVELLECLRCYQRRTLAALADSEQRWRSHSAGPYRIWSDLIFLHNVGHLRAEKNWVGAALDRFRHEFRRKPKTAKRRNVLNAE